MDKLVSIVVPVYKVEDYLNDCVHSLINQSYKNIEIILVDDGSPDKCPQICDDFAKIDSRIKVIHKKNGGLSDARNFGIKKASGELICFVDSDDVVSFDLVKCLVEIRNNSDSCKVSACSFLSFCGDIPKNEGYHGNGRFLSYDEYVELPFNVTAWGKLYDIRLFDDIEYPVGKLHEDEFTTYKLCDKSERIAYIDMPLYYYRTRDGSIVAKQNKKNFDDSKLALIERANYFYSKNRFQYNYVLTNLSSYYKAIVNNKYGFVPEKEYLVQFRNEILKLDYSTLGMMEKFKFFIRLYFPSIV